MNNYLTITEASKYASALTNKEITTTNISYLIQYGRIKKYGENGNTMVAKSDLEKYYSNKSSKRRKEWESQLGEDLNWRLSFEEYKESETTKHVHRLHPYKGKFIPQLVEYFLDSHTDRFKRDVYFKPGDIVLDPFSGSGTTMVQANELGLHSIGIDISEFNTMISNCKLDKYDIFDVQIEINRITKALYHFISTTKVLEFEEKLIQELNLFNNKYFPSPDYKYKIKQKEINEKEYGNEKEKEFLPQYLRLIKDFEIQLIQKTSKSFLEKWYFPQIMQEIQVIKDEINKIKNKSTKRIISLILSRTVRSCRATTHSDLATLIEPVITTYYCTKHGKICKPLFSIIKWWNTYSKDTIKRLIEFDKIRKNTFNICLTGDSRNIDLISSMREINLQFADLISKQKIRGIFSSPPYVGLIDYHEQHAYAYDLFGFKRNDEYEIGPLFKGQGKDARLSYIDGISLVLNNLKKYLVDDYDVFLVANDKYNLYPTIASKANMKIVNQFKRPVLNRTEKDKGAYSEIIFHLKEI